MAYAIETIGLSKEFVPHSALFPYQRCRKKKSPFALKDVNLQVKVGEIVGIVGPNGAGKTTLLKILSGLILPTKGKATICGYNIFKNEDKVRSLVGLVNGEERSFYFRLTLRQNLDFFAALYNLSYWQAQERIEELASLLEITSYLDKRYQECSTGIKHRLAIIRSLLNSPEVLFMDEPTKSIDPSVSKSIWDFIKGTLVAKQEKTIVFATHNLFEAESFAERIVIMEEGRVKAIGTVEELSRIVDSKEPNLGQIYQLLSRSKK